MFFKRFILVTRHILKLQKLKTHTYTPYWLFSKARMLVGADAIKIHSQMQVDLGGDQVETGNYQEKNDPGHHNKQHGGKHLVLTHRALSGCA